MKRDLIIANIGEAITEKLFELDDNYTYEADEFGREADCHAYASEFKYGTGVCEVEATVTWPYNKSASIEVLIYGKKGHVEDKDLSNIEKAVSDYLNEHLDTGELFDAILDDLRQANEDEYQRNGFASASDYYHWRYC